MVHDICLSDVLAGFKVRTPEVRDVFVDAVRILAVASRLRPMTWLSADVARRPQWSVPESMADTIKSVRVRGNHVDVVSVYNRSLLSDQQHDSMMAEYIDSRKRAVPAVERKVGRALGYLYPSARDGLPGSLVRRYTFERAGIRDVGEDFAQGVPLDAKTLSEIKRENREYNKVFERSGIHVRHHLVIGDA